jgi:pimeloyl-ACP methyl ester carboxylesterase
MSSSPQAALALSVVLGADTFAYLKSGTGPTLVIVHGVGGHKEDWAGVQSALEDHFTVLAVDMLGFGGSSRDAAVLDMPTQAAAIKALLAHEGASHAMLLGNSVGGWVTATFAATYPEMVDRLIVVDPAGFAAMFDGESPVNLFPDDLGQMKKLLAYVLHSDFAHTDEFATHAMAQLEASNERSIVPRLWPGLFSSERLEAVLPRVQAKTLVIWGREEKLFPVALAPYITGLIPDATSVVIDDASHFPQVDNPDAFIAAVREFVR